MTYSPLSLEPSSNSYSGEEADLAVFITTSNTIHQIEVHLTEIFHINAEVQERGKRQLTDVTDIVCRAELGKQGRK